MICTVKQSKTFLNAILFFILITGLWACGKELSYELNGNPVTIDSPASFILIPSGSNCSDANAFGDFQAGTALTAASQLTVTVSVIKTGNWKYTTATVNGFFFSGSGKFTATGSQSITLSASGTPVFAGNNTFPLQIGGGNCRVVVSVTPAGSGGTGTGDYYYKATIGGVNYAQSVTDFNGYEPGSGGGGLDDVSFGAGINYANPPLPKGLTEMGVTKGIMHNYFSASDADFKAFFTPAAYPYDPGTIQNANGVLIGWTDPKGESWDTQAGTGDQTGSTFKIISVTDDYDAFGRYYIKVKMQFNCKLYNVTTGVIKPLVNGEMVASFGKI